MPDVPLVSRSISAAPKDYVVPGAQEVVIRAVNAEIDGSGAAGQYLPALQLLSPAGDVMWTAVNSGSPIAAGASVSASWFQGLGGSGGGGTPTIFTGLPLASLLSSSSGVSIAADSAVHYVSIQDGIASAQFATTSGSVFSNGSTTLFTGSAVYGVQINAAGTYAILNNSFGVSGGTAGHQVTTYWSASNGSAPSQLQQGRSAANALDTWDLGQAGLGPHNFLHEWMTVTAGQTPAVVVRWGQVNGGTAVNVSFQMMVVQLSTNVLAKL